MNETYIGEGKHIRKTGGLGSHGHCVVEMSVLERGSGVAFESAVNNTVIPDKFISSVKTGVLEALQEGYLIGHPIVDVKITLIGGSYHEVDSKPEDFKQAAKLALKDVCSKAPMTVLEPISQFDINTPNEFIGAVVSDANKRRGRIISTEQQLVVAEIPTAETFGYATDLRSLTQGRADFTSSPCGYEEVPPDILKSLILAKNNSQPAPTF